MLIMTYTAKLTWYIPPWQIVQIAGANVASIEHVHCALRISGSRKQAGQLQLCVILTYIVVLFMPSIFFLDHDAQDTIC